MSIQPMTQQIAIQFAKALRDAVRDDGAGSAETRDLAASEPVNPPSVAIEDKEAQEERLGLTCMLTAMTEAARDLRVREKQWLVEMQQATVKLSVAIASRLIHRKIEAGEFNLEALVHEVVERLGTRSAMRVHLHPVDLGLLRKRLADHEMATLSLQRIELCGDPTVGRGGCRADAGDVSVLSRLDLQLAELDQNLLRSASSGHCES
jgi:flagellar biosynthesis/type III secretory pathway protein FliH